MADNNNTCDSIAGRCTYSLVYYVC